MGCFCVWCGVKNDVWCCFCSLFFFRFGFLDWDWCLFFCALLVDVFLGLFVFILFVCVWSFVFLVFAVVDSFLYVSFLFGFFFFCLLLVLVGVWLFFLLCFS